MKPNWKHHLDLSDIFHDDSKTFVERRDEIVKRIRATPWYVKGEFESEDLEDLLFELEDSHNPSDFDYSWDYFYDFCDTDKRVWIDTGQFG